jgi:hypothetical protein
MATTGEKVVLGVTGAVILGAGLWLGGAFAPSEPVEPVDASEEERPPVVVSNGSLAITVEVDPKEHTHGPGAFTRRGSKNTVVYHDLPGTSPPVGFLVRVDGSDDCTGKVFKASSLTVKYGKNSGNNKVTISLDYTFGLDFAQMMIDADGKEPKWPAPADLHKIKVHDDDTFTIKAVDVEVGAAKPATCTFGTGTPEITVRQVYKWPR